MQNLKKEATHIFLNTLERLNLERVMGENLKVHNDMFLVNTEEICLSDYKEVVVIGFGKASIRMVASIEKLLGDSVTKGILATDRHHDVEVKSQVIVAGHPTPNAESVRAGYAILNMVRKCDKESLIIFLISGGGSSLFEAPVSSSLKLEDIGGLNRVLVNSGASIREINIIRKHLSLVKGGKLGYLARKSRCVAIYLSDVNPGDIRSVASNPVMPDDSTLEEFYSIIDKYDLMRKLPPLVVEIIEQRIISKLPEDWSSKGQKLTSLLLLDNLDALKLAAEIAEQHGFIVEVDLEHFEGRYEDVADKLISRLFLLHSQHPDKKVCLISGGEVSCPVFEDGIGGRNQEFVIYSVARLAGIENRFRFSVLSCGTDGIDGNSSAAGAVADESMIRISLNSGLDYSDYIRRNDSNSFFKAIGGLVVTGPTGNNVRDIRILLAGHG